MNASNLLYFAFGDFKAMKCLVIIDELFNISYSDTHGIRL